VLKEKTPHKGDIVNDTELKKIAEDILVNTARSNWYYALDVENKHREFSDSDFDKMIDILNTATISVSWDD